MCLFHLGGGGKHAQHDGVYALGLPAQGAAERGVHGGKIDIFRLESAGISPRDRRSCRLLRAWAVSVRDEHSSALFKGGGRGAQSFQKLEGQHDIGLTLFDDGGGDGIAHADIGYHAAAALGSCREPRLRSHRCKARCLCGPRHGWQAGCPARLRRLSLCFARRRGGKARYAVCLLSCYISSFTMAPLGQTDAAETAAVAKGYVHACAAGFKNKSGAGYAHAAAAADAALRYAQGAVRALLSSAQGRRALLRRGRQRQGEASRASRRAGISKGSTVFTSLTPKARQSCSRSTAGAASPGYPCRLRGFAGDPSCR